LLSLKGLAANYYVATNGLDANPGTIGAPFKTIAHGTAALVAGDTLFIRGGVYREVLQPSSSGTAIAPIVITAYSNEVVTISGADVVTNWTVYSNSIYRASVNLDLGDGRNQVFVDGEMMHQARTPNFGDGDLLHPVLSTITISTPMNVASSADWGGQPANYWAGARFMGGIGSSWSYQAAIVSDSSSTNITLTQGTLSRQWFTGTGVGYLYGLMSMLDSDKEWHLDTNAGLLYLQIPGGDDPNAHLVEVKHRVFTVNLTNVNYVTVRGLHLRAGAVQMAAGKNLGLADCEGRFLSHFLRFQRNDAPENVWDAGVMFSATNSLMQHCTIYDTCSSAVYLIGASNTVTRNLFYNLDYTGVNGGSIHIRGLGHLITFNTISNTGWAGLAPQNDSQTAHKIMYNDISAVAQVVKDTGVFYAASGSNPLRTRLAYNWFHDVFPWRMSGVLIYLDGTCVNNDIDHNVCWNEIGRDSFELTSNSKNNNLYNNTIFNARPFGFFSTQNVLSNDLYISWAPDTQLMDWRHHDFRLKAGSTAIDSGVPVSGVTDGFKGAAPDLGAYESGGPYWVPGIDGWSVDQPGVRTDRPLSWNETGATIQGTLISAGTAPSSVYVCWGTSDGGTNLASWNSVLSLGSFTTNPITFTPHLTSLTPAAQYAYRFYATNANGVYWGDEQSFNANGGIWYVDSGGAWSDGSHWQNGNIPDGVDSFADFGSLNISSDRVITLDGSRTIGALRFDDSDSDHIWTISGAGTLMLSTANDARKPSVEVLNTSATLGVSLEGSEGLKKIGSGSLSLTAQNNYSGTTYVGEGTLFVDGQLSGTSVKVAEGALLGGNGRIDAPISAGPGSVLSPGVNGVGTAGTLTVSNLNLNAATLLLDFSGRTNSGNDLIYVQAGGTLTLQATDGSVVTPVLVVPNLLNGFLTNGTYLIASNAAAIVGDVSTCLSASGLPVRFSTNSGAGPYNIFMTVSNVVGRDVVWRGNNNNSWSVAGSSNWVESVSAAAAAFNQQDRVTFDDSTSNYVVNLSGAIAPTSLVVDNDSGNFTFQGSGKITGATSFAKTGTGALTLVNTNDYSGATVVGNGTVMLGIDNALPPNTVLTLGQSDPNTQATATLNLNSASQTVGSFRIASLNLGTLINTSPDYIDGSKITNFVNIGSGQNLTVGGNVTIGHTVLPYLFACNAVFSGGGSFNVQTNGGVFQFNGNDYNSSAGATEVFMDMSRLATANINLGSSGIFYVGDRSVAGDGASDSTLILASNTTVTAGNFNIGNSQRIALHTVKIGNGSTVFNVSNLQIGLTRDSGQMFFNGAGGTFKMRAADGASRASLVIGPNAGTTYGASNQFLNLSGHTADLLLTTLKVGEDSRGSTGAVYSSNYFAFSAGTLDTTTLRIGNRPGNPSGTSAKWFNVCDLTGGNVVVGSGGIVMGTSLGSNGSNSTNAAALNISGGAMTVGGDITLATQNATSGNNTVLSSLVISGGAVTVNGNILCGNGVANPAPRFTRLDLNGPSAILNLTGHAIGGANNTTSNAAVFVDTLNWQAGTLQNVGQINGGNDFVKTGSGALMLAGNNAYTGNTVVSNGTLSVTGTIGSTNNVRVVAGGTLAGKGVISGGAAINGALSPGISNVGTLRINGPLSLAFGSQTLIQLDAALHTNNSVQTLAQVNYGGALKISITNGTLAAGDKFVLFRAAGYGGIFSTISLPALSSGLIWADHLNEDGSISVVGPTTPARISEVHLSGVNLTIAGDGGLHNGPYQVLISTNIAMPLAEWTPISTNNLDRNGQFSNALPLFPDLPSVYFLIKQ
jgi:autotransporter-associated beta strand protein